MTTTTPPPLVFERLYTHRLFSDAVSQITDADELSSIMLVLLNYNRRNYPHPLRDKQYGFAACFRVVTSRGKALGFVQRGDKTFYVSPTSPVA